LSTIVKENDDEKFQNFNLGTKATGHHRLNHTTLKKIDEWFDRFDLDRSGFIREFEIK
jgi:hypothetical protein